MPIKAHKKGISVNIRLTPGAKVETIHDIVDKGDEERALKVSVRVPPEDGKANRALINLLAKEWKLPKASFSLLSGATSRNKIILVEGDSEKLLAQIKTTQ